MKIVSPELDPSKYRDLAVLKENGTFSGTFTAGVSGLTVSYGDGTSETSDSPSHTYSSIPPYIIKTKGVSPDTITGISISGNNLSIVDVEWYKNLSNLNAFNNNLSGNTISTILINLDERGVTNGTANFLNNFFEDSLTSEGLTAKTNLENKGWTILLSWTPQQISTEAWWDASDASTILEDDLVGSASNWLDKSGNGLDLQQTISTKQPTTDGDLINSLPTLRFDGNDDTMVTSSNPFAPQVEDVFVFFVLKTKSLSSGSLFSFGASRFQAHTPWSNRFIYFDAGDSGSRRIQTGSIISDEQVWMGGLCSSPTDNVRQIWVNGTLEEEETNSVTSVVTDESYISIGSWLSDHQHCDLGEFIIINDTVSTENRQLIEGYLAYKWGLVDNLPPSHPYKTLPPAL
jgi:hypothetical protein